jgi:Ala-tRNA(Pro) deacylase
LEGDIMRLDDFLTNRHVPFERLHHRPAYTANHVAQELHVPGKEMAKTVLLRVGEEYALAVLPATHRVDLDLVRRDLGANWVGLATEAEMEQLFPDCERGAMPPFGSLYRVPTIVDESLAEDDEIVFEGQTHEDAIRMKYRDYFDAEHPRVGHFATRH